MGDFFRGWRRKAGLVTLVMACVLAVGWMRSCVYGVLWYFVAGDRQHYIFSLNGRIIWGASWTTEGFDAFRGSFPLTLEVADFLNTMPERLVDPRFKHAELAISYWQFVLPLTLLSAWLILAKPRKAKAATGSTP